MPDISYHDMKSIKLEDIKLELKISSRDRLKDIHSILQKTKCHILSYM
jgi:hypothetical protein